MHKITSLFPLWVGGFNVGQICVASFMNAPYGAAKWASQYMILQGSKNNKVIIFVGDLRLLRDIDIMTLPKFILTFIHLIVYHLITCK